MTQILKPCPFCGGKAEIRYVQGYSDWKTGKQLSYFVLCTQCLTTIDNFHSEKKAAQFWNRRAKNE